MHETVPVGYMKLNGFPRHYNSSGRGSYRDGPVCLSGGHWAMTENNRTPQTLVGPGPRGPIRVSSVFLTHHARKIV